MPNFELALVELGQFIGLLSSGDDEQGKAAGTVQWPWFASPHTLSLGAMPSHRQDLHAFLHAILDDPAPQSDDKGELVTLFPGAAYRGVKLLPFGETGGTYVVWNEPAESPQTLGTGASASSEFPLTLGLGASASYGPEDSSIRLSILAHLISIANSSVESKLGNVEFNASFPLKSLLEFLNQVSLGGSFGDGGSRLPLCISNLSADRTVDLVGTQYLVCDLIRLATFVSKSWIEFEYGKEKPIDGPSNPEGTFYRLSQHLLPMLGDSTANDYPIKRLPIFDKCMTQPDFSLWPNSLVPGQGAKGLDGPMTFLWHLSSLITGNESFGPFAGSYCIPLLPVSGNLPPMNNCGVVSCPSPLPEAPTSAPQVSAYISDTGNVLGIRLANDSSVSVSIPLLSWKGGSLTASTVDPTVWSQWLKQPTKLNQGGWKVSTANGEQPWQLEIPVVSFSSPVNGAASPWSLKCAVSVDSNCAVTLSVQLRDSTSRTLFKIDFCGAKVSASFGSTDFLPNAFKPLVPLFNPNVGPQAILTSLKDLLNCIGVYSSYTDPDAVAASAAKLLLLASKAPVDSQASIGTVKDFFGLMLGVECGDYSRVDVRSSGLSVELTADGVTVGQTLGSEEGRLELSGGELSLGRLVVSATLPWDSNKAKSTSIGFQDLRLNLEGQGDGCLDDFLPDMREASGFDLNLTMAGGDCRVEGGGRIPIQQSLGPLNVDTLRVKVTRQELLLDLDSTFQMGLLEIAPYGLGTDIEFASGAFNPHLEGLAISLTAAGLEMAGFFDRIGAAEDEQFLGGATLKWFDLFQLNAIGGHAPLEPDPSFFVFASLHAPLGGPPWCLVTGVAGGLGYNRLLPAFPSKPSQVQDYVLMRALRGELDIDPDNIQGTLQTLVADFPVHPGNCWLSAGVEFVSFGFIGGDLLLSVSLGSRWSVSILGIASFSIWDIANFELALATKADEEQFSLVAGLTPNSYLIHPDLSQLQGDFGLSVWYAGNNEGDFVLSIGGYHRHYSPPSHYPSLERIRVKQEVYGWLLVTVEGFFACTPKALMLGGSVEVEADFGIVAGGFEAYADVFMQWDPFFLDASIGISVWGEFCGIGFEVGVGLEVWTPPFGGVATVDLELVSFDIEFGADRPGDPGPRFGEFLKGQARLTVTSGLNTHQPTVMGFCQESGKPGLLRLDPVWGRATTEAVDQKNENGIQEGVREDAPILVQSEFGLAIRTRVPVTTVHLPGSPERVDASWTLRGSNLNVPLCGLAELNSALNVRLGNAANNEIHPEAVKATVLTRQYPAALYGEPTLEIQSGLTAMMQVTLEAAKDVRVIAAEGIRLDFMPTLSPSNPSEILVSEELSMGLDEVYPLPLGDVNGMVIRGSASPHLVTSSAPAPLTQAVTSVSPELRSVQLPRPVHPGRIQGPGLSAATLKNFSTTPVVGVPRSPARRAALIDVGLKIVPSAVKPSRAARPKACVRSSQSVAQPIIQIEKTSSSGQKVKSSALDLRYGQAVSLNLNGGSPATGRLLLEGRQTVRLLFIGAYGRLVEERWGVSGAQTIPRGTRQVVLIGEGADPPVKGGSQPLLQRPVGLEQDTLLLALAPATFASHGCVIESLGGTRAAWQALDMVPGRETLAASRRLSVRFPGLPTGTGSLVLILKPTTETPLPLDQQVGWQCFGATLEGLTAVVEPARVGLVFPVKATGSWNLELDLETDYQFAGVALLPSEAKQVIDRLESCSVWDFVDDRWISGDDLTKIGLELDHG